MDELQQTLVDLLAILHRSMDWSVWGPKRLKYWDVFQENVAAAAYTDSMAKWLATFCNRMSITTPGRGIADCARLDEILNQNRDRAMLKKLREETQLFVLSVRVLAQERKAEWAALIKEREAMELYAISETGQPNLTEEAEK